MRWGIVAILLVLWILGFALHVAGSLIHILVGHRSRCSDRESGEWSPRLNRPFDLAGAAREEM